MTTHLDDGTLVRWLDRECEADEQEAARTHLETCQDCSDRLARFDARSAALAAALRAADVAPAAAGRASRWRLRAAAAIVVLLAAGGAVRPVRAWIAERAAALWATLAGETGAAPVLPVENAVSFVPSDGGFTVELAGRQAAGWLALEAVSGDTARAVVVGGSTEALVVLPGGLRIVNSAASAARYRIAIPARLSPVRVVVGGEPPRTFDPSGPPLEIDLGRR